MIVNMTAMTIAKITKPSRKLIFSLDKTDNNAYHLMVNIEKTNIKRLCSIFLRVFSVSEILFCTNV